jgi:hypothetical protein
MPATPWSDAQRSPLDSCLRGSCLVTPEQRFGGFARSALAGPLAVSWPLHHALLGVVADRGRALQLVWE